MAALPGQGLIEVATKFNLFLLSPNGAWIDPSQSLVNCSVRSLPRSLECTRVFLHETSMLSKVRRIRPISLLFENNC